MDQARYEARRAEALRLRAVAAEATVEFFEYLCEWERDEESWKGGTGWLTFAQALHASNVCKGHRLDRFKAVVAETPGGIETVRKIGIEAAEELVRIPADAPSRQQPDVPARVAVMRELTDFRDRNQTPPSQQSARHTSEKHYEPEPQEQEPEPTYDDRVKQLEHENARLVKLVKQKDREIERLSKALAAAEEKLATRAARAARKEEPRPAA